MKRLDAFLSKAHLLIVWLILTAMAIVISWGMGALFNLLPGTPHFTFGISVCFGLFIGGAATFMMHLMRLIDVFHKAANIVEDKANEAITMEELKDIWENDFLPLSRSKNSVGERLNNISNLINTKYQLLERLSK